MPARRSRPTPPRPGWPAASTCPAAAPRGKIVQIAASGAEVARDPRHPPGRHRSGAAAAVGESFYASHNWQPFFIEGTKTLAYELWEQLGFRVPDNILVPTGYGSNILGLDRGFDELERNGEIDRRPRLFAVQAANCAAFGAAWEAGADDYVPFAPAPTVADGIATVKPVRTREVLRAMRRSGGARRRGAGSRDRPGARRRSAVSACLSSRPPRPPPPPSRDCCATARSARTKPRSSS